MKGIILAGGNATRLFPLTVTTSKQLLPVHDRQMIFYPLNTLVNAGIRDILIIVASKHSGQFIELFGSVFDQSEVGISFKPQEAPRGLADAFIIGESYIGEDDIMMILGDNIFFDDLSEHVRSFEFGGLVFAKKVPEPSLYGVVEFDATGRVLSIEEKPCVPKSNFCVTGAYIYDSRVVEIAKHLVPSEREEIEITDINNVFLNKGELRVEQLEDKWFDAGSHDDLLNAANAVRKRKLCNEFHPIIGEAISKINGKWKFAAKKELKQSLSFECN